MPMITLNTPIIGISHKSRRTKLADGLMVFHNTGSISRADLAFTGIPALEVNTGLVARTALVLETDGDTGVTSGGAEADRLVIQHLTLLAWSTQPRPVAGVDAAARLTALVARTLLVTTALRWPVRAGEHALLVHQEAVLALAHRLVAVDLTLLVGVAGESGAGVVALVVLSVAGGGEGTVLVTGAALGHLGQRVGRVTEEVRSAGHQWLANVALRTLAPGLVQHN